MNKIKYNKKRSNKNIKSIPPYNKKGFFKTKNEFLLNKRYELFTNKKVIDAAAEIAAPIIELHTGHYADLPEEHRAEELQRIDEATQHALKLGLIVNAGHGLNYQNVGYIAAIDGIEEFNIGHSIIARSSLVGIDTAVKDMLKAIHSA